MRKRYNYGFANFRLDIFCLHCSIRSKKRCPQFGMRSQLIPSRRTIYSKQIFGYPVKLFGCALVHHCQGDLPMIMQFIFPSTGIQFSLDQHVVLWTIRNGDQLGCDVRDKDHGHAEEVTDNHHHGQWVCSKQEAVGSKSEANYNKSYNLTKSFVFPLSRNIPDFGLLVQTPGKRPLNKIASRMI